MKCIEYVIQGKNGSILTLFLDKSFLNLVLLMSFFFSCSSLSPVVYHECNVYALLHKLLEQFIENAVSLSLFCSVANLILIQMMPIKKIKKISIMSSCISSVILYNFECQNLKPKMAKVDNTFLFPWRALWKIYAFMIFRSIEGKSLEFFIQHCKFFSEIVAAEDLFL